MRGLSKLMTGCVFPAFDLPAYSDSFFRKPRLSTSTQKRWQGGFTLVELMVVLGLVVTVVVMQIAYIAESARDNVAVVAQGQIETIGKAVQSYIAKNTNALSGSSHTDLTVANLVSDGSLSSSFGSTNAWGSGYSIRVTRIGSSPNYSYEALVTTAAAYKDSAGKPYTGSVGTAVANSGNSALGMTYASPSLTALGPKGAWSLAAATYPQISAEGQLAYYISAATVNSDALYLRRDGTNAMTGNLNAGGNNLNNANTVNAASDITAGGRVIAQSNDSTSYGQTELRRWGLHNPSGDIYLEPQSGKNLYVNPNSWDGTGKLVSNFGENVLNGPVSAGSRMTVQTNDWAVVARDGSGQDNIAPQSGIGSAYVNDIYIRSAGKWASQLGSSGQFVPYNVAIPFEGSFDLSAYIPAADRSSVKAIQVFWGSYVRSYTNCCPGVSLKVDGNLMHRNAFDTGASGEYILSSSQFLLAPGAHTFTVTLDNAYRLGEDYSRITGYFK